MDGLGAVHRGTGHFYACFCGSPSLPCVLLARGWSNHSPGCAMSHSSQDCEWVLFPHKTATRKKGLCLFYPSVCAHMRVHALQTFAKWRRRWAQGHFSLGQVVAASEPGGMYGAAFPATRSSANIVKDKYVPTRRKEEREQSCGPF